MAISFAKVNLDPKSFVQGDRVVVITDVTLDSSYPTGGYTVLPSTLGLNSIDFADPQISPVSGAVYFNYNHGTKKLQAYANTGSETANALDASTCTGRIRFSGKGFPTFGGV